MTMQKNRQPRRPLAAAISLLLATIAGCNNGSTVTPDTKEAPDTGASIGNPPTTSSPPAVVTTSPAADERQIATGANLEATFSKALLLTSVDVSQFTLHRNGVLVPAQVSFDGSTATLDPDSDLQASAQYNASLNSGIVDNDGNALEQYQWDFYTEGDGWIEELIESSDMGDAIFPDISVAANGNAFAVWQQHNGTRNNIYANHYTASTGTWGAAELIQTDSSGTAEYPQVSVDADGNALAVWDQHDGSRDSIFANRYTASTGTWGTAELLETDSSGHARLPDIGVDADGNALAVWYQKVGGSNSIYANRYTASNGTWGTAELLETRAAEATDVEISVNADGDALAAWRQSDGTEDSIYVNRYTASTGTWGSAELIETSNTGLATNPKVAVDADGNALVVWTQLDGSRYDIHANRYTASTGTWGTAELIETDNAGSARSPQISVDPNGNVFAVWRHFDGTRYNIQANSYTASTGAWGTAELIEVDNAGDASFPEIDIDANGDALAVWYQHDGTRYNITANFYTASTGVWGTAELIEVDDAGTAQYPHVGFDGDGNAIVVWQQSDGTHRNIKSSRFDPRVVAP